MRRDPNTSWAVGVVLAGGRSRRMGRDKAGIRLGAETLAERAARRLASVCPEVLVADADRALLAGRESVADGPGRGPAAGILGAARRRPGSPLLVLACDLPDVPEELLAALLAAPEADWVVPRWERGIEPLCALYRPRALAALDVLVGEHRYGPQELRNHPRLTVRYCEGAALESLGDPARIFRNLNTPDDLASV